MTRTDIADMIVDICKNDAAFCKDIKGGDSRCFLSEITDEMSDKDFMFTIDKYLATFKVWGHLYFYKKGQQAYIGFHVRRYNSSLFVTHSEKNLPFFAGDEIVAIDGLTIAQTAEKFGAFFDSDPFDRQGERWEKILSHADVITIRQADKTFGYSVRTDISRTEQTPYEHKRINQDCFYIRLDNFFDDAVILQFIDDCKADIENSEYLIIDVRNNCGGNDTAFLPLLQYCLKKNDIMCGKPIFASEEEIYYTERNVESRIKLYKALLDRTTSEKLRRYYKQAICEQVKNKGKGFVPARDDGFLFPDSGTMLPKKIAVLTDYDCASSGESFVETVAKLDKVTIIGRPTMGICDYSNLANADFGEYVLCYPTSRRKAIDKGKGTRGRGLPPDIFIPWTPKHIQEDVDIVAAVKTFQK